MFDVSGDCLYELSELLSHGSMESLGICELTSLGSTGNSLQSYVEDGSIGPWDYGWDQFLQPVA